MINRKKRGRKMRRMVVWLILLILVLSYILFFSPIFKIRGIEVPGASEGGEISPEELKNAFNYKNIFLYTKNDIKNVLMEEFPLIADINISKNIIERSIKLIITERERLGIVCQAIEEEMGGCFYIDKQGVIFEDAPQTSGSLILLIKDYSQRKFYIGKKIFEENVINAISKIREDLFLETGIKVLDFSIKSFPPTDLNVMTSEGWYIIFGLDRDAGIQILSLKAALEEKIQNREELEYLDLRIENRIYYK